MGVLWFNAFIILGLLMRKLKFFIKFSVAPLLLLLVLSIFRMLMVVDVPISVIINSETIYPAIVNFLRLEIVQHRIFGLSVNVVNIFICIWIIVAVYLVSKHIYMYNSRRPFFDLIGSSKHSTRDKHAESLLVEIIGYDKHFRVFRSSWFSTPCTTSFKPYIILPEIDFSDEHLRVILLHEWKHLRDKDVLTGLIIDAICLIFWWNPFVYILKKNFRFAQELKCDRFAVSNKADFNNYLDSFILVGELQKQKWDYIHGDGTVNNLINADDEVLDRFKALAQLGNSRFKRILATSCFSIIVFALFLASYAVIILPIIWADVPISEDFMEEYSDDAGIYMAGENYVVDNGDGTFSFYIDGQFVGYMCSTDEQLSIFPIRARKEE